MPTTLRIASCNLFYDSSAAGMAKTFDALIAAGVRIIGVQELSQNDKQRALTAHAKKRGWAATTKDSAVTVFWDAEYADLVRADFITAWPGGPKWEAGTAGTTSIKKIMMIVELRLRATGEQITVLNQHFPPALEVGGKMIKANPPAGGTSRVHVYQLQRDAWANGLSLYGRGGAAVVGMADTNLAYETPAARDLEKAITAAGGKVCWAGPQPDLDTHGTRTIDWTIGRNVEFGKTEILPRGESDHHPVVSTITLVSKPPVVKPPPPPAPAHLGPYQLLTNVWAVQWNPGNVNKKLPKHGTRKAYGTLGYRPKGYVLRTVVKLVTGKDSQGKPHTYGVTEAGNMYALGSTVGKLDWVRVVK